MKHPDEKIAHTEKIIENSWELFVLFLKEMRDEIFEFGATLKRNFLGQRKTKKAATIIFALIILVPVILSYWRLGTSVFTYFENIYLYDQNMKILESEHEKSVKNFFQTFNTKYGVDCEWIKAISVDMNMAALWTERKPGKLCSLNYKVQIFPITIDNPTSNWEQISRVWGKMIYVIFNGTEIQNAWYQRYDLWRKNEWDISKWKINSFPPEWKERLK